MNNIDVEKLGQHLILVKYCQDINRL